MHSRRPRHIVYAILLLLAPLLCASAITDKKVLDLMDGLETFMANFAKDKETEKDVAKLHTPFKSALQPTEKKSIDVSENVATTMAMPFATIIQGANQVVTCPNDGSSLAKFFLCGTSDIRTISLSQSGSTYQWQKLDGGSCATSVIDECPTLNTSCTWNTVGTGATYNLNSGGEFRVRVNSGQYYYFKSSLNPLDPQAIKKDIICGNPGRVEVTNVPAGYEYSLNNMAGPYQDTPYFNVSTPGTYRVWVRLKNVSSTACVFPSNPVTINTLNMRAEVTAHDILCSGELGSIDVNVFDVPGYYTYRLIKNGVTVDTYGPNAADSYTFQNVSPGNYSIRVETNDCSELITLDVNNDPIAIGGGISPLAVTATANNSFGCGATSVDVSLNTTGGTAPYRFSLDGGTTFSSTYSGSTTFSVASAGNYSILVQDANGCTKMAAVDVQNMPEPLYTISTDDGKCGGANDGKITVNVTNTSGYSLSYSRDGGATFQTSNIFSGLAPNTYNIVIRYQQGTFSCQLTDTATINPISTINGTATADFVPTCTNENGGQITISGASGGAGGYEYSIGAGFSTNPVFTNLGVGTYTPYIRDANGCVRTLAPVTFAALNKPTDLAFAISNIDCLSGTVSVSLTATGGSGSYTYQIVAPASSAVNNGSNPMFNNIALGTYTFRVTDTEGCSYEENYAITNISSISAQAQATRGVTCVGNSDGEGRFLIDGFDGTYSYSIDGSPLVTGQTAGIIPLTGRPAGDYTISVTDEITHCTDTATLTIREPAAALAIDNLSVVPMSCQNHNIGGVTIITSGGWGGNRYSLTLPDGSILGPMSGNAFTNLSQSGTYVVTVNDANGCTVTDSFVLTSLTPPVLDIDYGASDFCFDNVDGSTISVTASSGVPPYRYRINNGAWSPVSTFALAPGNYAIEVADANNCRDIQNITIAPQITVAATTIQELECSGPAAQIRITVSNGYTSASSYNHYEVSVNGGAFGGNVDVSAMGTNTFTYSIPNDGSIATDTSFQFRVYDARGCSNDSNVVTISPPETINGTATGQPTVCGDPNSGVVVVQPDTSTGVPPYQYSNDGGATWTSQNVFTGYAAGNYNNFMVRDSRGCTSPLLSATVDPSVPVDATVVPTDAICSSGAVEGSIDVTTVANGTANYTYVLQDIAGNVVATVGPTSATTANFPNVPLGTYTVITTDATGCEDRDTVTIDQNELTLTPVNTVFPPDCTTAITYVVDIGGGTAPYQIGLVGGPLGPPNVDADTHDFTGQVAYGTTYFVEVVDANGCRYIQEIPPIAGPDPLTVTATGTTASCDPLGNGEIFFEVNGIPSPADIAIRVQDVNTGTIIYGPTTISNVTLPYNGSVSGLLAGNYQVLVEDVNSGCAAGTLVDVIQNTPSINADLVAATCNSDALVTVRGSGGTPGYSYAYVPSGTGPPSTFVAATSFTISGPYPTDYDFYVQDASGCISFTTVTVTQDPGVPDPTVDVVNQCSAQSNYTVMVTSPLTLPSGLPEDTFQYDIGGGFQDSPNFTVPNPGTYTIVVRDGYGCTNTVVAEVFDFFSITASATSQPTCNAGDGIITVTTSGGSGNFSYQLRKWDTGAGMYLDVGPPQANDNTFENIDPGNYNVVVTDLDSNTFPLCSDDADVEVTTVIPPEITASTKSDVTCYGASDGSIQVDLTAGTDVDGPFYYTLYKSDDMGATYYLFIPSQPSPLFTGLDEGYYEVEVISERNCSFRSGQIIIINPPNFQVNAEHTDFSCDPFNNKFNTSLITVYTDSNGDGTGTPTGTPPYTYAMDDGTAAFDGTDFQDSNVFELVDNGTTRNITIIAKDKNGCEVVDVFTIGPPTDLLFSYNVHPIICDSSGSGVNAGAIDIIMAGGPGNYDVEILPLGSAPVMSSGGSDTVTWPIDTPGDYIFAVTDVDNGGCSYLTQVINVPEYNTIQATVTEANPVICFNGTDGAINLDVTGYSGVYTYEVFSRDNAGVETTTGVTGSFDTNNPLNSPEIITGLPGGNLVVRVEAQDTPYCDTMSNVVTVRSPNRILDAELLQTGEVTCALPGHGQITINGDGGWGGYQYRLEGPSGSVLQDFPNTNNVFSNLDSGTYTVSVRDAEGCIWTDKITLDLPVSIAADIEVVTPLQCNNDNDAEIRAWNVTGGQGPGNYLYQLDRLADGSHSGLQSTPNFGNLSAGDYTITVFDGWECSFTTAIITVDDPEVVEPELVELQPPGCGFQGRMELMVTNPEPNMQYYYRREGTSDPFVPFSTIDPYATSVEISVDIDVDPGPFQYEVQNSNGCPFEKSNQISLDPAATLVVALDLTNATINCSGESTGIIRSEAFGGIGNYLYTLVNTPSAPTAANTVRPAQTSGIFRDLPAGDYYVYVGSGGCEAISNPINILPKPPLVLDHLEVFPVSCNGLANGQIAIEASGGSGAIRYAISNNLSEFFEGNDPAHPNRRIFTDLEPKTYEIIIQDDLGCTITQTITIDEPEPLYAAMATSTPETCLGDADGNVTLEVMGGTPPYYTSVNSMEDADFVRNDNLFIDNLQGGETYVIFVRDAMGCETNVIVPVGIGVLLEADPIVDYGCDGIFPNNTVTIQMTDTSLLPDLLFSLDENDISKATSNYTFGDLSPGEHTVYIFYQNGCASFVEFTIEAHEPLTLSAEKTGPNELTAMANGGYGDYHFTFDGEESEEGNVFHINMDAIVEVEVRDAMGCVARLSVPFDFTGMLEMPDFFTPDGDLLNDTWYPKNREMFENVDVKIFDRYGRVVAELDQVKMWDGTYNGKELPSGDYWYVVNANDKEKQQYVGHFTLYR